MNHSSPYTVVLGRHFSRTALGVWYVFNLLNLPLTIIPKSAETTEPACGPKTHWHADGESKHQDGEILKYHII